jgi:hypothetical protein
MTGEALVAITIRNKQTEAMIRAIGKRWKEGPSAVISRLARQQLEREKEAAEAAAERRVKSWDELMALAPPRDPNVTWDDLEREMDSLFDDLQGEEPKQT